MDVPHICHFFAVPDMMKGVCVGIAYYEGVELVFVAAGYATVKKNGQPLIGRRAIIVLQIFDFLGIILMQVVDERIGGNGVHIRRK